MKISQRSTQLTGATILAAAALAATTVHADQVSDIRKKGELACGVFGTDESLSFLKSPMNREIVGYDVGMYDAIAKSLGVKPVPKQLAVMARLLELQ